MGGCDSGHSGPCKDLIVRMYLSGAKISEIVEKTGASIALIYRVLRERGVRLRKRRYKRLSVDDRRLAVIMYCCCMMSKFMIAERLGVSYSTIHRVLRNVDCSRIECGDRVACSDTT